MKRCLAIALFVTACGGDDGTTADAGLDAMPRISLTVDGTAALRPATRSVKITITASDISRTDTIPVGGLPATVDVPAPIFLTDWDVSVDGFDMNVQRIGHGMTTLPSGSAEGTVMLSPI